MMEKFGNEYTACRQAARETETILLSCTINSMLTRMDLFVHHRAYNDKF